MRRSAFHPFYGTKLSIFPHNISPIPQKWIKWTKIWTKWTEIWTKMDWQKDWNMRAVITLNVLTLQRQFQIFQTMDVKKAHTAVCSPVVLSIMKKYYVN